MSVRWSTSGYKYHRLHDSEGPYIPVFIPSCCNQELPHGDELIMMRELKAHSRSMRQHMNIDTLLSEVD